MMKGLDANLPLEYKEHFLIGAKKVLHMRRKSLFFRPKDIEPLVDDIGNSLSRYEIYENANLIFKSINNFDFSLSIRNKTDICFLLLLTNPFNPSMLPIHCKDQVLNIVLCSSPKNDNILKYDLKFIPLDYVNIYKCAKGQYISVGNLCDGVSDCPGTPSDEQNCKCNLQRNTLNDNIFCSKICHPSNCSCSELYNQKFTGGCILFKRHLQVGDRLSLIYRKYQNNSLLTFTKELQIAHKISRCYEKEMIECIPWTGLCYFREDKCQYILDNTHQSLLICFNGKHLENCTTYTCTSSQKCPNSYCIPFSYICDGKWDCWDGSDENNCNFRTCKALFKCKGTSICVYPTVVCDQYSDCPLQDDELFCHLCPKGCTCLGLNVLCEHINVSTIQNDYLKSYSFIRISKSIFLIPVNFHEALAIYIYHNNVNEILQVMQVGNYSSLQRIEITFNCIQEINICLHGMHLNTLQYLDLTNNNISKISHFGFRCLRKLTHLDLSYNNLNLLLRNTFIGLPNIVSLKITNNLFIRIKLNTFQDLPIKVIITHNLQICCALYNPTSVCTTKKLYLSGCRKMLPHQFLQFLGFFFGFLILGLNICLAIFLLKCREYNTRIDSKITYNLLTGCLHISDLCIAICLLVTTLLHTFKGDSFIEESMFWKKSILCSLLSILYLSSFLTSCLLQLMISLSRYLVITYLTENPLKYKLIKSLLFSMILIVLILSTFILVVDRNYYELTSPLCFFPGIIKPKMLMIVVNFIMCLVLIMTSIFVNLFYFIGFQKNKTMQKELAHSLQRKDRSTSLLISILITVIPSNVYYLSLSLIYLSLAFKSNSPDIVHYYTVFLVLPINPVLNIFVYHLLQLKHLLTK